MDTRACAEQQAEAMSDRVELPEDAARAALVLTRAINASLDLDEVLQQVTEQTRHLLDIEEASIILWDPVKQGFEMGASTNIGGQVAHRVRREGGVTRQIMEQRRPVLVPDTRSHPPNANPLLVETHIRSYVGVPIQCGEEVSGVLYALSHQPRAFSEEDLHLLSDLAALAGVAIQNARSIRELQALNAFKEAMIRMAAHDLRNPLGLTMGYLSVLLEDLEPLSATQQGWVAQIERALARMEALIDGILDYEWLSSGAQIEREPCNLNAIAREIAAEFEAQLEGKRQSLTLDLEDGDGVIVPGDALLLRQAAANLLSNAVKYTPIGGAITLRTRREEQAAQLSIQDSGPGITQQERAKLFQPFTRFRRADSVAGSGLGLSLVKIIVERHGGTVNVESKPGEGSAFSIILPAVTLEAGGQRRPDGDDADTADDTGGFRSSGTGFDA